MSRVTRVSEALVGLIESLVLSMKIGPQVGERMPPKYQALFSDGALAAAPYVM